MTVTIDGTSGITTPAISGLTTPVGVSSGGTNITTYTTGDVLYASATNTLSKLGIGSSNQVLSVSGGVPTWATPATGALTLLSTSSGNGSTAYNLFTSDFSNTYITYFLIYYLYKNTTSSTAFNDNIKLFIDGSLSSSNYFYSGIQTTYNSANTNTYSAASGGSQSSWWASTSQGGGDSTPTGVVCMGTLWLTGARTSTYSGQIVGLMQRYFSYYSSAPYIYSTTGGVHNRSTFTNGVTGIQLITNSSDVNYRASLYGVQS